MEMHKTLKFEQSGKEIYVEEGHKLKVVDHRGVVYEGTVIKISAKEFQLTKDDEETVVIIVENVVKSELL